MSDINKTQKTNLSLTTSETADFLRGLADKLEGCETKNKTLSNIDIKDFSRIKVSFKKKSGLKKPDPKNSDEIFLKFKLKKQSSKFFKQKEFKKKKLKYKTLKKRMKTCFKKMMKDLLKGELPKEKTVDLFIEYSEMMITFPKKGEEFYDIYIKECMELKEAYDNNDIQLCIWKIDELHRIKTQCHKILTNRKII